jgi:hypothetical protein
VTRLGRDSGGTRKLLRTIGAQEADSRSRRLRRRRPAKSSARRTQVVGWRWIAGRVAAVGGRETCARALLYRITLVLKPDEAEAGRLACDPGVIDDAIVTEEVAQIALIRLGRNVADENLRAPQGSASCSQRATDLRTVRRPGLGCVKSGTQCVHGVCSRRSLRALTQMGGEAP